MAGYTAQQGYEEFLRTGQYANNPKHFESEAAWSEYKHMIPQQVKKDFRDKVAGNEDRAIQGMMEGKTREQMGIYNRPEEGQALYRRLGMGLGTGLDMNTAYNWDSGMGTEVGTSDLARRGIAQRGITGTERQRWNDFSSAGSPEQFWSGYRQQQIGGLMASGAIARDAQGYYNPGPGNQDRYGANLEGYNFGVGPMGRRPSSGGGQPSWMGGQPVPTYSNGSYESPYNNQAPGTPATPPAAPQVHTNPNGAAPAPSGGSNPFSYQPPKNNSGFAGGGGGMPQMPKMSYGNLGGLTQHKADGAIFAADGYTNPVMPPGPLPDGGTPLVVHPGENVNVTPANQNPAFGGQGGPGRMAEAMGAQGHGISSREIGPGMAGVPSDLPNGRSPFASNPMPMPQGSGIVWGPNGPTAGGGGNLAPNLPGVNLPGQIPITGWGAGTPWGQGLMGAGGMDNASQGFALDRARNEYAGSFGPEQTLMNYYGQALGVDPATGQPLQGQALDASNRQSFGMLAPQAERLAGDQQSAIEAIKQQLPPGGARDQAIRDVVMGSQSNMLGLRQDQAGEARAGLSQMMQMKKGFDPSGYQGGNQALLGAELGSRGQDLSALLGQRGQDIDALMGQRGQDSQWGLGWGGLANSSSQNLWDSYFTGRGQDLNLYSNTRGQDLGVQQQQAALQAQRDAAKSNLWGNVLGAVGGIAGTLIAPGIGTVVGAKLGSSIGGGFSMGA
jgi:hypothetical protein